MPKSNERIRAEQIVSDLLRQGLDEAEKSGWKPDPKNVLEDNAKDLLKKGLEKMMPKFADLELF